MASTTPKIPLTEFTTGGRLDFVQEHDSGWVTWKYTQKITAAADAALTLFTLPANTSLTGWAMKAIAVGGTPLATATHLGLGVTGTLEKFGKVADNLIDDSDEYVDEALMETPVFQSTAASLLLSGTNGSGTAAGSFTGSWYLIITGRTFKGFDS